MTNAEFSNQFDVLYNNIMSNQAPGLDEYEKSVFLTKAQNEIVLAYFNPTGNKLFAGFDGNEERQIDFSMLMRTQTLVSTNPSDFAASVFDGRTTGVKSIVLPSNVLLYVNERLEVTRGGDTVRLTVIPISYAEYNKQMSKPYKRPTQYQAWRLINATESSGTTTASADLIAGPNDTLTKYVARYIKRPRAIILSQLEGVTLDNVAGPQTCELDPILHEDILQRAVELAKAAYTGDLDSTVALGNASATEKGIVPQASR